MSTLDSFAVRLTTWIIHKRWLVMFLTLASVGLAGYGGQYLNFSTNYRVFFSKENPQLNAFEALQAVYTKTDNIIFVIKPKDGDIFSPESLKLVQELTEASWQLPYSIRVDSITNFQHTFAEGDDLTVKDLVEKDPHSLTEAEIQKIRQVALDEPLLQKRLISEDAQATGVNITFNMPEKSITEVPETVAAARKTLTEFQERYPEFTMVTSGIVMMNNTFSESSQADMTSLIPLMYLVLLIAMALFLRSISSTIATLFVIAFSALAAMGIAGWMGISLTPPSASAPTVILTLAIADSVHIIISMMKSMHHGFKKHDAIIESMRINFQPVFLTSLTTAIGFLSLNFSDAPPFHDLGNITAIGVTFAFLFSITFLPALLSLLPMKHKALTPGERHTFVDKIGNFVIEKRHALLISTSAIVIGLGVMVPQIELNDRFVQYFDKSIEFRRDTDFMMENLTGIYQVEYSIGAEGSSGISAPEYLNHLEAYTTWLRNQPEVINVYSMTDIFKRLNKNMHGDDPSWYKIPDTKEMAAQYLLLYEFSLPYGLDINDRINIDKSATRVSVTIDDMSTGDMRAFKLKSEQWLKDNTPSYMHTEATSPVIMFAYISERNIDSMIKGNFVALLLISLSILIALRSVKIGLISLIPNIIPAVMGFGLWSIFVGYVNMAGAMIAAISLGIIVDDSVHFLSKYNRARREKNLDPIGAARYAFSTVGTALVVTTLILIAGFLVLTLSAFELNFVTGALTAIVIACALFADFLLLPPLLMLLDRGAKKNITNQKTGQDHDYKEAA